jgi:3'-phosphoadenosine 5'-phosphosulfate sulfotransferase (PAPS reductase)/FAD synthetase
MTASEAPRLRVLSLGAGVQSTTLFLLAAEGRLPRLDAAVFADTGWEPTAVYRHLERLERVVARPAGIPVIRTGGGNIRADALDPMHRFASMPLFVRNPDGTVGMIRRQCTDEYKLKKIKREVRALLGYPTGRVPSGVFAEQWVGISRDEFTRAKDSGIRYAHNRHPLLELDWTRADCLRFLARRGWQSTPKSACIGCPFHSNAQWREMRDHQPEEWADAVAFDYAIRDGNVRGLTTGSPLLGKAYLHRSCLPLDRAPIDKVTTHEWGQRQGSLLDLLADQDDAEPSGCSPWTCRGDDPDTRMAGAAV